MPSILKVDVIQPYSAANLTISGLVLDDLDLSDSDITDSTFSGTATISGGSITGITDLAVADGGTGASTAADARTNLGAAASGANTDITSLNAPSLGAATATTQSPGTDNTTVATTEFVNDAVAGSGVFTTGDVKMTFKTTADSGWVLMDDGTIGNGSSGASTRANADTEALFTLLWNNTANAQCPVSSGRGANAAADYAANKTITLPRSLGRAIACYGAGDGLTSRALAEYLGDENMQAHTHTGPSHTHTGPSHTHTFTTGTESSGHTHSGTTSSDGAHTHTVGGDSTGSGSSTLAGVGFSDDMAVNTGSAGAHTHTMTTGTESANHTHSGTTNAGGTGNTGASGTGNTGSTGSGSAENMQPTVFLNLMIKL